MSDLFFRAWINNEPHKDTDTHYRLRTGAGSFNWRMKFQVEYPSKKPTHLHLQAWGASPVVAAVFSDGVLIASVCVCICRL